MRKLLTVLSLITSLSLFGQSEKISFSCEKGYNGEDALFVIHDEDELIVRMSMHNDADKDKAYGMDSRKACLFYAAEFRDFFSKVNISKEDDLFFNCDGGGSLSLTINYGRPMMFSLMMDYFDNGDKYIREKQLEACLSYAAKLTKGFYKLKWK